MIETPAQLEQARATLASMEAALLALRARVSKTNPSLFEAMGQDYLSGIQTLRDEIDTYLGIAAVKEAATPLWMVLEGERLDHRAVSSRLLADWLGRLRKAIYNVSAFLENGTIRTTGRPDARLLAAADPCVLAVAPGSIRIGLRLPAVEVQSEMFPKTDQDGIPAPTRALHGLLVMAAWGASESTSIPLDQFASSDEAAVVARHAATLMPSRRGEVKTLTFSGGLVPSDQPLRLTSRAQDRLRGLSQMLRKTSPETIVGQLREIDLDAHRIILRERGPGNPDVKCILSEELLAVAEQLLDQLVVATGVVFSDAPDTLYVTTLAAHDGAA